MILYESCFEGEDLVAIQICSDDYHRSPDYPVRIVLPTLDPEGVALSEEECLAIIDILIGAICATRDKKAAQG